MCHLKGQELGILAQQKKKVASTKHPRKNFQHWSANSEWTLLGIWWWNWTFYQEKTVWSLGFIALPGWQEVLQDKLDHCFSCRECFTDSIIENSIIKICGCRLPVKSNNFKNMESAMLLRVQEIQMLKPKLVYPSSMQALSRSKKKTKCWQFTTKAFSATTSWRALLINLSGRKSTGIWAKLQF